MQKQQLIKLALLNIGIAAANIFAFSDGLLHIRLHGAGPFQTALGITIICMSLLLFAAGNYRLLFSEREIIPVHEIKTHEDCVAALEQNRGLRTFSEDIEAILEQIRRFDKKESTVSDILLQRFLAEELSYQKFMGTIREVENVFYINIKSILNKINAFDEEEYHRLLKNSGKTALSPALIEAKTNIYREYIRFVKDAAQDNEEIILKLDKVLLEISRLGSLEEGELEHMGAMQEIDELISNTKWYRQ